MVDHRVHASARWSAIVRPTVFAVRLFERMCAAFGRLKGTSDLPLLTIIAPELPDHVIMTTNRVSLTLHHDSDAIPPGADRLISKDKANQALPEQVVFISCLRQVAPSPGIQGKREHACRGRFLLQS